MNARLEFNAWSPGIQSQLPREILPLSSILRSENVFQTFSEIEELCQFTGINKEDIAAIRPERLVIHELLIRVMANYSVSDGNQYADLGVNFREMVQILSDKYVQPHMESVVEVYDMLYQDVSSIVEVELESTLFYEAPERIEKKTFWQKIGLQKQPEVTLIDPVIRDAKFLSQWQKESQRKEHDDLNKLVYEKLSSVCGSIMSRHGRIHGEPQMLINLVVQQVCNTYGSALIGEHIGLMISEGAAQEGFRELPIQQHPMVMNVKGSSAAGKSTLRPLQNKLVQKLDIPWEDFALISPDIFRKFLLDYGSLGDAFKYAGICAGHELKIVDQKLDLYMANKAQQVGVPHLLIDRFRFDSFTANSTVEGSNLLTRFGSTVYMFYMLTPPHETVERAYTRGLKVGRFKAVDDLLDHNVETFTGMPELFFTWALDKEKDVHYEFLDNTVELGETPKTVAYGRNGSLSVFDVEYLINIDRFRKININAHSPEEVYPDESALRPERNLQFFSDCVKRLDSVDIIVRETRRIAARIRSGKLVEWDMHQLSQAIQNDDTRAAILSLFKRFDEQENVEVSDPQKLPISEFNTLGQW